MLLNFTSILSACTLISCASLVHAEDGKRPGSGSNSPLTRAPGTNGSSSDSGRNDDGSRVHGLDGERWQDRVPRQPMWLINTGAGLRNSSVVPEDNAKGLAVWWRGDRAIENFIDRIQQGYDNGARWFLVNRPMGTPGNTHVPGASWLTMSDDKRDLLPEKLSEAVLDHFEEPVHVVWFVGSDMADPREYAGWTVERDDQFFGVGENDTWEELVASRVTLGGWISTGASGIGIDHSSHPDERGHYIRLFEQLNQFPFNLAIYGEAYPLEVSNGRIIRDEFGSPKVDQHAITSMPWIGSTTYLHHRWPAGAQSDTFPLDEDETRMFVWFEKSAMSYGSESERIQVVNDYMDRGLIPITLDPVMFREAVSRMSSEQSSRATAPPTGGESGTRTQQRTTSGSKTTNGTKAKPRPRQALPKRYQPTGRGIR